MGDFYSRLITQYCERSGNGFLSEPFNTLSSFAIIASAYFIYRLLKKHQIKSFNYWFLFTMLLLAGIGSVLWHSFRNPIALAIDAIPVYTFFFTFLYLLLARLTKSKIRTVILLVGFFAVQVLATIVFPTFLNGTIRHFVNGIFVLGLLVWLHNRYKNLNRDLLTAFLLYILAIIFRSIDNSACSIFPVGTHFLWHILNATASYFVIRGLIRINSSSK